MDNQNETLKVRLSLRNARIQCMKDEIHARGCVVSFHYQDREMWVRHLETGWRSYVRYEIGDLQGIEEAWEKCRDIAFFMWSDFHADSGRLPVGSRRSSVA